MTEEKNLPTHIQIRGARAHNLKNIDVDIPLHKITGIAGVSGSGSTFGTSTELLNSLRLSAGAAVREFAIGVLHSLTPGF